jgi:hypothetical protein
MLITTAIKSNGKFLFTIKAGPAEPRRGNTVRHSVLEIQSPNDFFLVRAL